ncbi:WD domain-containing protein [Xylariaceae sp. FL0016]|nr:WD domain-containing protein [Xylariaceae sp. FL0016]
MYNQGKIMRRLLGRPNTESSSDGTLGFAGSSVPQTLRPNAAQNVVYESSFPIACFDRSPDGRIAVLGGRHVLKTIHIDGVNIKEGVDVRSIITSQFGNRNNAASLISDQLSIKDVKIASNHGLEPTIFTACANGKIFMYDVSRLSSGMGLEFIQTIDGSRQVNKLDINPHHSTWMLSGGQDGVVRCFDVKNPVAGRNGPTFRTLKLLRCNADGIRDVKWCPKDGMVLACATESGVIMKWDIRKTTAPLLKINAHDTQKGVSSISWHPDGDHLISSGLDSKCHVWDLSKTAERRQKPKWTINAPAPVTSVSWRPGLWSATAQGRRAAQVAVSYDEGGHQRTYGISAVHIWDLARPTMPYKEIDIFDKPPYSLLWHDQNLLWAAGQDGFSQCDVAFAPKVMDRQPLSNLDFSTRGNVMMFLEERVPVSRPRHAIVPHEVLPTSYSSSPSGQMLSISRSDSEEDVIGSFLGPKKRSARKWRANSRAAQTLSTTPPSGPGLEEPVLSLEQAIKLTGPFRPHQVMAIGHTPAAKNVEMHQLLSQQYLEILKHNLPYSEGAVPLDQRIARILELYARAAEVVSQFRLAQTWRVLAYAMNLLLSRRSQHHLERRLTQREKISPKEKAKDTDTILQKYEISPQLIIPGEETPRETQSVTSVETHHTVGRSLLTEEIDNESTMLTPLVRAVKDDMVESSGRSFDRNFTLEKEVESFILPSTNHPELPTLRKRLDSQPLSIMSQDSQISSTEGYDFYDVGALETAPKPINVPRKKEPLSIDVVDTSSPRNRRRLAERTDSEESFSQVFPLSDSSRQASNLTSSSGGSIRLASKRFQHRRGNSDNVGTEYGSRIRGRVIAESPEEARHPMRPELERNNSSNLTDDFMMSQPTTDSANSYPSYMEESHSTVRPINKSRPKQSIPIQERRIAARPEDHVSPDITETDFLPWEDDPPYPHPIVSDKGKCDIPPIDPCDMVAKALAFETKHSALNASAMILLLGPLVPKDVIDPYQASAIVRQHHKRLMGMKLFVEASLLRNLCVGGWPEGLDMWGENYPAVFQPAQDKVSVAYICAQCHKPREINHSDQDSSGVWKCERCRTIMAPCAVCGHREPMAEPSQPTPVADTLKTSPDQDEPLLTTWWYCPGCSHGGHANCLQDWHAPISAKPRERDLNESNGHTPLYPEDHFPETNSDGCCPFDGCGHACLPGKWRNENNAARTEELGRAVREQYRATVAGLKERRSKSRVSSISLGTEGSPSQAPMTNIRSDTMEVTQSRAVESVRESLSVGGSSVSEREGRPTSLMGILSSSPGRASSIMPHTGNGGEGRKGERGERERRKSVKFAGPGPVEERR